VLLNPESPGIHRYPGGGANAWLGDRGHCLLCKNIRTNRSSHDYTL